MDLAANATAVLAPTAVYLYSGANPRDLCDTACPARAADGRGAARCYQARGTATTGARANALQKAVATARVARLPSHHVSFSAVSCLASAADSDLSAIRGKGDSMSWYVAERRRRQRPGRPFVGNSPVRSLPFARGSRFVLLDACEMTICGDAHEIDHDRNDVPPDHRS